MPLWHTKNTTYIQQPQVLDLLDLKHLIFHPGQGPQALLPFNIFGPSQDCDLLVLKDVLNLLA